MQHIKTIFLCALALCFTQLALCQTLTNTQHISPNANNYANKNTSLATSFGTDLEPYPNSFGLGYTHSFMQTSSFSIQTIGTQLQYTRSTP